MVRRSPLWFVASVVLAALVVVGSAASILGSGQSARAQESQASRVAMASIVPSDALLFARGDLDPSSEQYLAAQELLFRAGFGGTVEDLVLAVVGVFGDAGSVAVETGLIDATEVGAVLATLDGLMLPPVGDVLAGELPQIEEVVPQTAGGAAIFRPAIDPRTIAPVLAVTARIAEANGSPVTESLYEGVTIYSASAAGMPAGGLAIAAVGEFLVVSQRPQDLHAFIDTAAGREEPLTNRAAFDQAQGELPADRLIDGFLNGGALAEVLSNVASSAGLPISLATIGQETQATVFAISADQPGFRVETVQIPLAGETFSEGGAGEALTLANDMPADSLLFVTGYGLGTSFVMEVVSQSLVGVIGAVLGGTPDVSGTPVSVEQQFDLLTLLLGFDLRADLLANLNGEYGFSLFNVDLANPGEISALLVSDVDDGTTVAAALAGLGPLIQAAGQGRISVTTRSESGGTVSVVEVPLDAGGQLLIEYGVVEDQLLLGINDGLTVALAGPDQSLASVPDYRLGLDQLPSDYDGIFYLDVGGVLGLVGQTAQAEIVDAVTGVLDATDRCQEFSSQDDAQSAYDNDPVANFDLDLDFDGLACEDAFMEATPRVNSDATPAELESLAGVGPFTLVSYKRDGNAYTSGILLIDEAGE